MAEVEAVRPPARPFNVAGHPCAESRHAVPRARAPLPPCPPPPFLSLWAADHALMRAAATARFSGSAMLLRRLPRPLRLLPSVLHWAEQ